MDKDSGKTPACKDGRKEVNARLTALVGALDRLGFQVMRLETNGLDFDLKIRDRADKDEY